MVEILRSHIMLYMLCPRVLSPWLLTQRKLLSSVHLSGGRSPSTDCTEYRRHALHFKVPATLRAIPEYPKLLQNYYSEDLGGSRKITQKILPGRPNPS